MTWNNEPTYLQVAIREAIGSVKDEKVRELCREVVEGGRSLRETSEKWGVPEWKILRVLRRTLAGVAKEAGVNRRKGRPRRSSRGN